MHNVVKLLAKVAERYYPSRVLSFEPAHIFKALQLIDVNKKASRSLLVGELGLGEGSIKTLVRHLKMNGLVTTSNSGMTLTSKVTALLSKITGATPSEADITESTIAMGRANHAILVKALAEEIGSGIEQRDAAIMIGALGATTLLFHDNRLYTSDKGYDIPINDQKLTLEVIKKLRPENGDVIIIASAENRKTADLAAKRAALETISHHERHS